MNWLAITTITVLLIGSAFSIQLQSVYASERSPYDSGYDHGCDDAGLSPSDRYINEPGKGPSFHTDEFMSGYYDGFNSCGGRTQQPPSQGGRGINWEGLCNQYGHLVGIKDPCSEYADGPYLTQKGRTALVCLLGGAITLLAGLDATTKTAIIQAGRTYCP